LESCPFCHEGVTEDLLRFGGTCPSCLGEIPGEETPTDPGAEARAVQEAADLKAMGSSRLMPVALLSLLLVAVVLFAVWVLVKPVPEPVASLLDFDDAAYALPDVDFVAYVEPEPEPKARPRPRPRPRPKAEPQGTALDALVAQDEPELQDDSDPPEDVDAEVAEVAEVGEPEPIKPTVQSGGIPLALDVGVRRRATKGVRLTDDSAIVEMLKSVLTSELPRLKSCYEQQLKVNDRLAGRWILTLVVGREGNPMDIAVKPTGTDSPELQACIAAKVSEWSFQPIRADQPVQKTLTFVPGL
jgi:hypothetical protein